MERFYKQKEDETRKLSESSRDDPLALGEGRGSYQADCFTRVDQVLSD